MAIRNSKKKFRPTDEQKEIFDALKFWNENLMVEALAGTGKSTTQEQACRALGLGKGVGIMAFNKSVATEMQSRGLPRGVWAGTMHSRGYGEIFRHVGKRLKVDKWKYRDLVKEEFGNMASASRQMVNETTKLIGLVRDIYPFVVYDKNTAAEVFRDVSDRFGLNGFAAPEKVLRVLDRGLELAGEGHIDFSDMIWAPLALPLKPNTFELLMVDECQDLNPAQIEFAMSRGNRIVAVGDRHQSIYGFRGADPRAMEVFEERLTPSKLPLTLTMRCPKRIVGLANMLVPALRALPDAKEGQVIEEMSEGELPDLLVGGELVMSRVNAPLVPLMFRFWKKGKPAAIIGRDYVEFLLGIIDKCGRCDSLEELRKKLDLQIEAERLRESQMRITYVDACETLLEISVNCDSIREMEDLIKRIFVDSTDEDTVRLSTIHRAKGLEAETCVLLNPELLPHPMAEQQWEIAQELNLAYVAVTRVKGNGRLYVCGYLPSCFGGLG